MSFIETRWRPFKITPSQRVGGVINDMQLVTGSLSEGILNQIPMDRQTGLPDGDNQVNAWK